jgi:hypothetical protein
MSKYLQNLEKRLISAALLFSIADGTYIRFWTETK